MSEKPVSRQRLAQLKAVAEGLCRYCFRPRGDDGVADKCRPCRDKYNLRRREKKRLDKLNAGG